NGRDRLAINRDFSARRFHHSTPSLNAPFASAVSSVESIRLTTRATSSADCPGAALIMIEIAPFAMLTPLPLPPADPFRCDAAAKGVSITVERSAFLYACDAVRR